MHEEAHKHQTAPQPGDTRQRILKAAIAEFTEYGLDGARVDRIAGSAGVNKALLYYYFSSKENLFSSVIDEYLRMILPLIQQSFGNPSDPDETLGQVARVYAQLSQQYPEFIRLLVRELARPDSRMVVRAAQILKGSGIPGYLLGLLRDGVESGTVRDVDLKQAAVSFLTLNLGYFVLAPMIDRVLEIDGHEQFVTERAQANVDLFLRGILRR
jgi:TetR/AcrR family transcriptional regulator